ncbi:DUF1145 domain-containing protein [Phytopseudomonas dryadis]|uniref:DUF1145 domain-containing protein n=1 Tax=Phytopseudomonas dryadis TaxID=2487520 RepID=A0A4Q9R5T1_9GAMM|nr:MULTISPECIES: DUF1145 domain-containing protein [Pseudomonas]TBU94698.1 hypothetical protein DNK44_08375 [Pseudomonas dryadis]TBV06768.1 hypothetical protein DNK34_10595 [Pseudomonas dryadis]TBV18603.1 hypothetical protein DNK41_07895 [Pseudomonas sp. FRB 230]
MKTLLGLGKLLAALFWCVVLANLIDPFAQPFAALLALAGVAVLVLHGLELALFNARLREQTKPWSARLLVLAFGILHVWTLTPQRQQGEVAHA